MYNFLSNLPILNQKFAFTSVFVRKFRFTSEKFCSFVIFLQEFQSGLLSVYLCGSFFALDANN